MKLEAIQALRGIAALMVVLGHAIGAVSKVSSAPLPIPNVSWGAGVDLFFVISGFIILYSSERLFAKPKARANFLFRRAVRVVPLYWLCTAAFVFAVLIFSRNPEFITPISLLTSFLFIPYDTHNSSGFAFPILDLGWTLNYEVFFYVLFAAFVSLKRNAAAIATIIALALVVSLGQLFKPESTILRFWTAPILLEFALGISVAAARLSQIRLDRSSQYALILAGLAVFVLDPFNLKGVVGTTPNDFSRLLGWGVPAAVILAGLSLGRAEETVWRWNWLSSLGDWSYSLYLTHPFAILTFNKLAKFISIGGMLSGGLAIAAIVSLSVSVSFFMFKFVEAPVIDHWKRDPVR